MSDIYAGADITLAATVSPDACGGLFRITPAEHTYQYLTYETVRGQTVDVEFRKSFNHGTFPHSVLLTRAWAFQERLLSRRIFVDTELWFECSSGILCQCARVSTQPKPDLDKSFGHCNDPQELCWNWQNLVGDYSSKVCNLTYSDDVFPALQGLAKSLPPCMGAYLAGHWKTGLSQSLSWCVREPLYARPAQWRAPSWSWASVSSQVYWSSKVYGPRHVFIKTVSSITVPKESDPTGQLESGEIIIIGQCLSGKVAYSDMDNGHRGVLVVFDAGQENLTTGGGQWVKWNYQLDNRGPHQIPDETPVLVLKLDRLREGTDIQPRMLDRTWLVLKRMQGHLNVYERIGLLRPDHWMRNDDDNKLGNDIDALHQEHPDERELIIR
jgi:hypothetical protein